MKSMHRSVVVLLALSFAVAPLGVRAQSPDRFNRWDPAYQPPMNEWGQPDLQGNWTNATITPLQRPAGLEPVYSRDEVDRIEGRTAARVEAGSDPSDPDRPPPDPGNVGAYNEVFFERGGIAMVNGEARTSLITFPPDGRIPPLSPEGQRRKAEYDAFRARFGEYDGPELRPLVDRCIVYYASSPTGTLGPPMSPTSGYNNNVTIVQNVDHVVIRAEMIHDVRIIRLGEPEPVPGDIRPWFGDSWGRWEGNTLVVETTHVHPGQGYDETFDKVPYSDDYTVRERFTRVDDDTILYEFEVDDPGTYSQPWGGQVPYERFDDQVLEYDCHEGNYAIENSLRGARYQESQGAARRD
jgi:hypothetical protein